MRPVERALVGAPALLLAAQAAPNVAWLPAGRHLFPALRRVPSSDVVALTFDDGPADSVDAFLGALQRAGARATFFVTGEQVARAPSRVAALIAAGHEVGVHGYRHRIHLRLTPRQVSEDLRRARATIEAAAAQPTSLFRPPYGVFSLGSWRETGQQGWTRVLWSRWGRDWEARASARSIAEHIGQPRGGDILLLHDADRYGAAGSWRRTLDALPIILERLAEAGLQARPLGELLGLGPPAAMDVARA